MPKKAEPKPDLTYVPEGELPQVYLLVPDEGGWRTKDGGTTESILSAGTFGATAASDASRERGDLVISLERAVREATRAGNPVVVAAIAALGGR